MATKLFQREWTMKQRQAATEAIASANGGVVVCERVYGVRLVRRCMYALQWERRLSDFKAPL